MVQPTKLIVIGYWDGPDTSGPWPDVQRFIDPTWDEDERDFIADYLRMGFVSRAYMGYSICRVCGKRDNGDLELTDGTYVWPDGLVHYVIEHDVRLPGWFVSHAHDTIDAFEEADRSTDQWRSARLEPIKPPRAEQPERRTDLKDETARTIF